MRNNWRDIHYVIAGATFLWSFGELSRMAQQFPDAAFRYGVVAGLYLGMIVMVSLEGVNRAARMMINYLSEETANRDTQDYR